MKTLYLLRHAKSAHDKQWSDHERPLDEQGRISCRLIAEHIRQKHILPDLVLCSSAARTQETLERITDHLNLDLTTNIMEDLYLAPPSKMLNIVRQTADNTDSALIVGHNPGIGELMRQLAGSGNVSSIAALAEGVPTCALARIDFDTDHWAKIKPGRGILNDYVTPPLLTA